MSITFGGGLTAGTLTAPHSLLRATFSTNWAVWALPGDDAARLAKAYDQLARNFGGTRIGYVASAKNIPPGAKAMTLDIRRSAGPAISAAAVAAALDDGAGNLGPNAVGLVSLALVQPNEGAQQASENREEAAQVAANAPSWGGALLDKLTGASSWLLVALLLVALFAVYLLFRKG